ncbi:DNA polymerase alpha catalytic subunit [Nymphaea colorata]|nr:DNA polymerase alpha catalytic subunit [Nymphaea colorata]
MEEGNRRRSTRGPSGGDTARASALERLKAIRESGRSAAGVDFQVRIEEPIYDTVPEEAYAALVAKRREAVKDFIVDDNGLGYGDLGEEEDWERTAYEGSSSEDDHGDDGRSGRRKKGDSSETKKNKKKKKDEQDQAKRPSSLSAAAALMGKQRLSSMFTSSAFQRNTGKGSIDDASIIDQVIAEITPDEVDRERRRRRPGATFNTAPQPMSRFPNSSATALGNSVVKHEPAILGVKTDTANKEAKVASHDLFDQCHDAKPQLQSSEDVPDRIQGQQNSGVTDEAAICDSEEVAAPNLVAKVEVEEKREDSHRLNAKITFKSNPEYAATAGWQSVWQGENNSANSATESKPEFEKNSEFFLDSDGSLPFFVLDAYEELHGENRGKIYLFGKVKVGNSYASCCVIVKNMQRCIFAIPHESIFPEDVTMELERTAKDSDNSSRMLRTKLQEMALPLKTELSKVLMDASISTFSMTPVKRNYAFERSDVAPGERYVIKINYPFKDATLPSDIKGEHFSVLFGANSSALELFLIKRRIKGPSWISISKFFSCPPPQRVSWCKYEVVVDSPKDVTVSTSKAMLEIPPIIVASLSLKTVVNERKNTNEIVSASVVCCHKAKVDVPMVTSEWNKAGVLSHFTIVRKLEGGIFPLGFTKEVADRNSKSPCGVLVIESSERALLSRLMIEMHKSDCDVLLGHNISGFDIDVLLHRAQALNVLWSKIGRLKRSVMPKLTKGSSLFGSGASPGVLSCISGRLLCDTYLSSRELLKEASYSLTHLAKSQLGKDRKEISPLDIPLMFQSSSTLLELVEHGETDAWLSLGLMFHLSMLPLTRQLTNIAGNLWGKTLQGARAQRVEYLLLHAFHELKYILPDKASYTGKDASTKRGLKNSMEDGFDDQNISESGTNSMGKEKHKKGPAYSGGLVLEPKKGLYDKFILLLDFNSLYPSIIQEYNICFTTVQRNKDGAIPALPSTKITGVLPKLLHSLVDRRRKVKQWMKNTSDRHKIQQLDIQQQALKLTANSIYGCLGFTNSRFYAKPLAELITLQGREILQSTVDLVQNQLNYEVIYGDTDSIMIHTGLDDISEAKSIATKVKVEVNKKYRCLEIDLDGLYKRMLLLKKKKYAAVKVQFSNDGSPYEVIERKGLDMVRRDWSLLSKELGDFCLGEILSGGSCEDVVESIHGRLMKVQEEMRNGEIELDKYVIMKTLTKLPEEYPDAKNQPHVQVALRMKQNGISSGCSAGDTVPYVICCQQGLSESGSSTGIAQRARHPDELKHNDGTWMIDIDYYLSQQIHPVVSRLCACIEGTSPARLADCLGLESSKFQHKSSDAVNKDLDRTLVYAEDDNERYRGCQPLWIACPSCFTTFECPATSSLLECSGSEKLDSETDKESENFWTKLHCPKCPIEDERSRISPAIIANQVRRQAEKFISKYYMGLMTCDDELCQYTTRSLNLRVMGDSEKGTICPNYPRCNGHLVRQYTEVELYKQLSYFCHVLDTGRCLEKMETGVRVRFEKQFARIRQVTDLAAQSIKRIRDRCAYTWIKLEDLALLSV